MAGKKKTKIITAMLYSTAKKEDGSPTGCFYICRRNPRNVESKLEFRKYDWVIRKMAVFKEQKIVYQAK